MFGFGLKFNKFRELLQKLDCNSLWFFGKNLQPSIGDAKKTSVMCVQGSCLGEVGSCPSDAICEHGLPAAWKQCVLLFFSQAKLICKMGSRFLH